MSDFEYYNDLDSHPFSGLLKLSIPFNVKVKNDEYIERFFNGTPNYGQVKDVTIGKVYTIYAVEGYGMVWLSVYFLWKQYLKCIQNGSRNRNKH